MRARGTGSAALARSRSRTSSFSNRFDGGRPGGRPVLIGGVARPPILGRAIDRRSTPAAGGKSPGKK
ncbi:MAG: hypothetical protein C0480_12870 [Bradyrhizobium sp.]|nr:hypothetical protein [Bradyrhizobium sp.]